MHVKQENKSCPRIFTASYKIHILLTRFHNLQDGVDSIHMFEKWLTPDPRIKSVNWL